MTTPLNRPISTLYNEYDEGNVDPNLAATVGDLFEDNTSTIDRRLWNGGNRNREAYQYRPDERPNNYSTSGRSCDRSNYSSNYRDSTRRPHYTSYHGTHAYEEEEHQHRRNESQYNHNHHSHHHHHHNHYRPLSSQPDNYLDTPVTPIQGIPSNAYVSQAGGNLSRHSQVLECPWCHCVVTTDVKRKIGAKAGGAAVATAIVAWPLFWVPLVVPGLKRKIHYCPQCHRKIGRGH